MHRYDLVSHTDRINELLARYGVKFGIYKNNTFKEQLFPFDSIPRVIEHDEFTFLERGLKQRVTALNMFLQDIYGPKQIVRDGIVPEEFIYISSGYMAECEGVKPIKGIHSHISGIDLVKGKDENWYILEDNLRVPSGASYPMIARDLCRKSSPKTFREVKLADNRNYASLLKRTMDNVNTGGRNVILTPGRCAGSIYGMLFKETALNLLAALAVAALLIWAFNGVVESLLGVPHIYDVFRKGNVALLNAPGNGVADDKGAEGTVYRTLEKGAPQVYRAGGH